MKRLTGTLLALTLVVAACGGSPPEEAAGDDIAALDEAKTKAKESSEREKDGPGKGSGGGGGKKKTKAPAGGEKASGGGGAAAPRSGGGGGGKATPPAGSGGGARPRAAATPVPEGRYEYATDGRRTVSGNEEPLPDTTTLTATAPANGTQRQTRDLRDSDGNGIVTETDLLYRGGDVFLSYVKITSRFQGGLTDVREFRLPRPELIAPAGAGPGTARSFTMEGSGTRAKVSIRAQRYEDVTVAGDRERALVVQTTIRFSGALEGHQRALTWFWPKHLLPLREQVLTDVRNGPIRLQSEYEAVVRRLP